MYADICAWPEQSPSSSTNPSLTSRKLFVVDGHPLMRQGYKALVQSEPDLSICDEAAGGYEALEKLYELKPDLVITDVTMEDLNGFELTRRIKGIWRELPVLVVSNYGRDLHGSRAREVGACGFLEKHALAEHGLNVIRCALTRQGCPACPYLFGV